MPRRLADYLENFLRRGREPAYIQPRGYRSVRCSYQEVAATAFQFARELESRQIGKGDRIFLWGPNSAEWVAAFFGCLLRGAIVVPMDDSATPDFALRVHLQVSAKLLLCSRAHNQASIPSLVLEDLSQTLDRHSPAAYPATAVEPSDPLEIVFTSGTTADPKGVVITHGNVLANIAPLETEIRKYLKYERWVHPVRFLNLLPLSHVFGQFLGIFLPQLMGATVIFQDSLNPTEIISTIRRERVSVLVAVPRVLQALQAKIERDLELAGDLEHFRRRFDASASKHFLRRWWIFRGIRRRFGWKFWAFISGGASLDRDTEEFWGRLGYAAIQGYGLTETTSLISVNHPFRLGKGSIGKVLPGREVKLAADGEILVRGGGVATGYWSGNQLHPVAAEDGWFPTGDIGELDPAGNLYFKGRKKEVIVTPAGMNIYPEDLEAALRRQPEVKDALVIPMVRGGNAEPCAVLILTTSVDPEHIVHRANQSLAEYQRMNAWSVWPWEDFPRTATQKPRRNLIAQTVAAQASGAPQPSLGPLAELITRITGRSPRNLSPAANLASDLNLSSLDRVELLSALEDRYQVDIAETSFAAVATVGDLEQMLHGKSPARMEHHYPRWTQQPPVSWIRLASNYLLLRPAVFFLGSPRIEGRANLRGVRGPVLVICNHISDLDAALIIATLPHHLGNHLATATRGEALEALRTPPPTRGFLARIYDRVRWALGISLLNLFPLPREAGFRGSFAFAGETVDRGYSVLVFPEGRHSTDGNMTSFRPGIGLLAANLAIPVVPMRIRGLFDLKQAGRKFARSDEIKITIGAPVSFAPETDPQQIARELQIRVEEL